MELSAEGYPVMELEGGFEGWKENDLPIETSGSAAMPKRATSSVKPNERSPRSENL
jgi:3-mercaptopyruvate sulfurtransferase SseA